MLENFGVFRYAERMESQLDIVQGLRERYEHVVVEDKGDIFNTDLTQALELGSMLDLAWVHGAGRTRARGEPRRSLASCTTSPSATTSASSSHSVTRWDGWRARALDRRMSA